jgi:hypothetical protein
VRDFYGQSEEMDLRLFAGTDILPSAGMGPARGEVVVNTIETEVTPKTTLFMYMVRKGMEIHYVAAESLGYALLKWREAASLDADAEPNEVTRLTGKVVL